LGESEGHDRPAPGEARAEIERDFGAWSAAGEKPPNALPPVAANPPADIFVPDPERLQASVTLAETVGINRFDPDYYALEAGNNVLGGGFYATRLYHDLRQVNGYVYNVDVSLNASKTRATYTVVYGCDPDKVSKARELIVHDLEQMRTQDVSDSELHLAKAMLLRQIPLSAASEESLARGMAARAEMGLPLDEPVEAAKKYLQLSADDVKNAFAKHVNTGNLVQIVRGPAPQ